MKRNNLLALRLIHVVNGDERHEKVSKSLEVERKEHLVSIKVR